MGIDPQRKFRELILWLCSRSETDPFFGATKLNKLLFFIDLEAMRRLGRTITAQRYQKLPQGPAPRSMVPVMEDLSRHGDVVTRVEQVYSYPQKKTFAMREPDLGVFTSEELEIMDECLKRYWNHNATSVSMESHDFIGWQVVREGDDIPLGSVFISKRPLSEEEIEYGRRLTESLA